MSCGLWHDMAALQVFLARPLDSSNGPALDRLDGWKDIASYLNKSVRTAVRWEKQLGLPVRRLHTEGGEIVFAFRNEIDDWLRRNPPSTLETRHERETRAQASANPPLAATRIETSKHWFRTPPIAAALVAAVGFGWALATVARPPAGAEPLGPPTSWKVTDTTLVVFDPAGQTVWKQGFAGLETPVYARRAPYDTNQLAFIGDVDRKGGTEVLFNAIARTASGTGLYCFDPAGHVRFEHHGPSKSVRFGDVTYDPPFSLTNFLVAQPPDKPTTIWTSAHHSLHFPTAIQKLDADGHVLGEFWMNGRVQSISYERIHGKDLIFVGGTNNETRRASLAVLDYDHPEGSAPATSPSYRCSSCPEGLPAAFLLFPRTELSRNSDTRPYVFATRHESNHRLTVSVLQMSHENPQNGADVHYYLSDDLHPIGAEFGDSYGQIHATLERQKYLNHPLGTGDSEELFPLLRWQGTGFTEDRPPTTSSADAARSPGARPVATRLPHPRPQG